MGIKNISRRIYLKFSALIAMTMLFPPFNRISKGENSYTVDKTQTKAFDLSKNRTDFAALSNVYISRGRSPEENMKKAIGAAGGIEELISKDDIVILKPNAQWWNQGTTNTNNMKGFIELVLNIPDFTGEIIIAENHHYKEVDSRGWNTDERNGDFNLNELVLYFNKKGHQNISKYHWVDGGPNPQPQEGDGGGGHIVKSVHDGDGYVWLSNTVYTSPEGRRCIMTYPVFTSKYSGKQIDLRQGSLQGKIYVANVKFINFSCLNHHSAAFGVTASIKNLMGVTDMTCGFHGTNPKDFYNMHFIGKMSKLYSAGTDLKYYGKKFGFGAKMGKKLQHLGFWNTQYTGGALGYWLEHVRMPDLNILAAEYVGWGGRGRGGPYKRAHANCVAISKDPVALDYIGAKNILLPATPIEEKYYRALNDPDNFPFKFFLKECHAQGIGNLSEEKIKVNYV